MIADITVRDHKQKKTDISLSFETLLRLFNVDEVEIEV